MNTCRTCLETPAEKHILELEKDIQVANKNSFEILRFCLDIEVTLDPKITTNLCCKCYTKIVSFYNFKALSLKNDSYLKSLGQAVRSEDQKLTIYVNEKGIKHENLLDVDEYGPSLVEQFKAEIKIEVEENNDETVGGFEKKFKNEDTLQDLKLEEEPLCLVHKVESSNKSDNATKTAPVEKISEIPNKPKPINVKYKREVCKDCGKLFRNIKEHALQHQPKEERQLLTCEECPKLFINKKSLKRHQKNTHLGAKSKCDICHKEVTHLTVHKQQVHKRESLRYPCQSCDRRYLSQSALDLHLTVHTRDLKFECDICHKMFRLKNNISRHIRDFHQREKNYPCEFCDKAFFDKGSLTTHLGSHSQERQFKCNECDKAFKTMDYLRKHFRFTHSDAKLFNCDLCSKSFKRSSDRNDHMRTHSQEKPFQCRMCDVRFTRSSSRRKHERAMHKKSDSSTL